MFFGLLPLIDHRSGVGPVAAIVLGVCVFGSFLLPWTGVSLWALRRASDLNLLIDRTRGVAADNDRPVHDREFHGELDELARGVEELRVAMAREKAWSAEQRSTLQEIAAALGEGILAMSPRGRIVLANERIREMFGTRGDMVGRPLLEVIRSQPVLAAFEGALQGHASTDRITIADRQIETRVFPVVTSTEVAAVALFIDVTQLERLQRVRKEFLDDFSHEVRTPLAGLSSAVDSFEGGGFTAPQEEQLRGVMRRQLRRIERLVSDLSELNRIESGDLTLEKRPTDLYALLSDLVDDFQNRLSDKPLRFSLSGTHVSADCDPGRAQQIFGNLLDNAWKHGGTAGEVRVEVATEEGLALVRVSDQGGGIAADELNRIFHRFYRIDKSRSQSVPGVGLGLAIAKHLVLVHGGTIRAFNRPEGGATFEVRLPATET